MAARTILLTVLEDNPALAKSLGEELSRSGLNVSAHLAGDQSDTVKATHEFLPALTTELRRPALDGWVIAGQGKSFADKAVRSLLSLALLSAEAEHGTAFPVVISPSGVMPELPPVLARARVASSALGARTVAALHRKESGEERPYRLDVLALPGLGLWLETGPVRDPWKGALMGASGKDGKKGLACDAHGVGTAGTIPTRSTLQHQTQGMLLRTGDTEYTASGVMNPLSPAESYYVHLPDLPGALLFGPFPENDDPELYSLKLC